MKENNYLVGIDIGGTKCALSFGLVGEDGSIAIAHREEFPTKGAPMEILEEFARRIEKSEFKGSAIGISCGGPLDSKRGVILSPPNLPTWDNIEIVKFFTERFGVPVNLQNDANACAYAEWKFGAGRGTKNMVFMTFGTGLGAGIVIDGKLYSGTNDNAGEIGHLRLAPKGPVGYNKEGSEGFCSGAGMTKLARIRAEEEGIALPEDFSTKELFRRIDEGDQFCLKVFKESAAHLGMILSYVIDILNPEVIVLGGVFMRQQERFMKEIVPIIEREALPFASKVCKITGANLSENIGDYAALAVAGISR